MSLMKLRSLARSAPCRNFLQRVITGPPRATAKTQATEEEEDNTPIKYSTSPAVHWTAEYSQRGGKPRDSPFAEPLIIIASVSVFMFYFFWLRESNDIDEIFDMELGDHFPEIGKIIAEKQNKAQVHLPSAPKM